MIGDQSTEEFTCAAALRAKSSLRQADFSKFIKQSVKYPTLARKITENTKSYAVIMKVEESFVLKINCDLSDSQ